MEFFFRLISNQARMGIGLTRWLGRTNLANG